MKTRQFRFVPGAKVKKRAVFGMVFLFAGIMSALAQQDGDQRKRESKMLADNVFHLSEVMLHDVANPPAASRFYAYCTLGAYEVARCSGSKLPDLDGRFNVNPGIKAPPVPKKFNLAFSANYALLEVGRQIMPSGYMLEEKQKELVDAFKASGVLSERNLNKNIRYAQELARQVLEWHWVRLFSPFINTYAFIFLVGGAVLSAWRFSKNPKTRHRFIGNVLIAVGALLPGIGGTFTRFGYTEVLYITEMTGILLIFAGYKVVVDVKDGLRQGKSEPVLQMAENA